MRRPYICKPRGISRSFTPAQVAADYAFPKGLTVVAPKPPVIAIIELGGGYTPSDTAAAFASYRLPAPNVVEVSVQGATNSPGTDADGEVALDVQVAAAVYAYATGQPAQVRLYWCPNTDAGFAAGVAQAAADGCSVCSISWGGPEDESTVAGRAAMDAALQQGQAAGMPTFVASGDNDANDGEAQPTVDYPAASPFAVGCGGTTHNPPATDVVWNDGTNGTGGGFSQIYPSQSWQIRAPAGQGRMVPDIAGDADPNTGYQIVVDGQPQVIGGTSAVAPLMSGLFTAISAATGANLGNVLPTLYQNPQAFVDIVSGNNGAYSAAPGPDPCTGLGVPIGTALLTVLSEAKGTIPPPVSPPPVSPPTPSPTPKPKPPTPQPKGVTISEAAYAAAAKLVADIRGGHPLLVHADARALAAAWPSQGTKSFGDGWVLSSIIAFLQANGLTLPVIFSIIPKIVADVAAGKTWLEIVTDILASTQQPTPAPVPSAGPTPASMQTEVGQSVVTVVTGLVSLAETFAGMIRQHA